MKLPIELIPGSNPPKFRWWQTVTSPVGSRRIMCEGSLPSGVEGAVIHLINIVNAQQQELEGLRGKRVKK